MPMDTEIARSFLDWSNDDVLKWLSNLSLSEDYSSQFRDKFITGETLIKLSPGALDELKIIEGADRVKILQQITTMRADIITELPSRRVRSPIKNRRFSDTPTTRSPYSHHSPGYRQSLNTTERTLSPVKQVHTPIRESSPRILSSGEGAAASPFHRNSPDSLSLESPSSSRMSSPIKLRSRDCSPYATALDHTGRDFVNKLQSRVTLRNHNMKRLSRSLDGLFLEGEDIFDLAARSEKQENNISRLAEILKDENASLKRELETYYKRVRKLQKLEQEIEHIREGHRMLEVSAARREKLEGALRTKLEKQVHNLRGENIHLKAELHRAKKQEPKMDVADSPGPDKSREIRRRDTMIMRLIRQNQESVSAREQLEKDLQSTRIQLIEYSKNRDEIKSEESLSDSRNEKLNSETEMQVTELYTESIEKLRSVLSAMQSMSQKREQLEKHLRTQLLSKIRRLKGESEETAEVNTDDKETKSDLLLKVATLEADVNKWEQKCLELVAEKQMVLEAAVIPRDSRMKQLERTVSEQASVIGELHQQRANYVTQLSGVNQRLAEVETKLSSMKMEVHEKDTVIQALQNSFLDPDEIIQDEHISNSSPILHHSPVATKKYGFPIGSPVNVDGAVSLPGDMSSIPAPPYSQCPPTPPLVCRGLPNGTYGSSQHNSRRLPGGQSSPHVQLYSDKVQLGDQSSSYAQLYTDKGQPGGQSSLPVQHYTDVSHAGDQRNISVSRSLSPVKRHSGVPVYVMKEPYNGRNPVEYIPPPASHGSYTHYSRLSYPAALSKPDSPDMQSFEKTPPLAYANLHFAQVSNSQSHTSKSNVGPQGTRVDHPINHPINRSAKSKTPPPNYKLVSHSMANASSSGQTNKITGDQSPYKQRHHSADDTLGKNDLSVKGNWSRNSSMELFNSLVGVDNVLPRSEVRGYSNVQVGVSGTRQPSQARSHQHSKSSPGSEKRNVVAFS